MIREALCDFFKGDPDCDSTVAVPDISSAIQHLQKFPIDVVLLDYDLGNELAFAFFERIQEIRLTVRVLVVSAGISTTPRCGACSQWGRRAWCGRHLHSRT